MEQGLLGSSRSAQSAAIAPLPENDSVYYVFTVDDWASSISGLNYSIVDMKLRGGLGDIIQ